MPQRTREDLRRSLGNKQVDNLYLLFGAEDYLRQRAAAAITNLALKDAAVREFNDTSFNLLERDVQDAIAACEQLPMMSARRVVRVTNFNKLTEADDEILMRYVARPSDATTLIFIADDLDKRKRLSKTLLDACTAIEFPLLEGAELKTWGRGVLRELNSTADERTLAHIIGLVGNHARTLRAELGKLAVAALPEREIRFELVDRLTLRSRELSNFDLADYLIKGERRKALQTLQTLLEDKAEPLMLLGLIASQYRRLLMTKEMMSQGKSEADVFKLVGLPFNKRQEFLATARRSNHARLTTGIRRIAATDLAIKTSLGGGGMTGARLQIEMLVCELTQTIAN